MAVMILRFLSLVFCFLALAAPALAQSGDRSSEIDRTRQQLADVRASVDAGKVESASDLSEKLRALRDESRQRLAAVEREIETVRGQLAPLGQAPGEGEPPESEDLTAQREKLNLQLADLNGQKTRINANIIETGDLIARLSASRVQTLYERLLTRDQSPLSPETWVPAWGSLADVCGRIGSYFQKWGVEKQSDKTLWPSLAIISGALLISILLFGPVERWVMSTFSQAFEKREPTPGRRVVVAGLKMLARATPGLVGGAIILETLRAQEVITAAGEPSARILWFALVDYLLVSGFTRGLFSPANPNWRIAPIDASRGQRIGALIVAIVVVFGLKLLLVEVLKAADGEESLIRLIKAAGAIGVGVLLFLVCRTSLWRGGNPVTSKATEENEDVAATSPPKHEENGGVWRIVRRLGRVIAVGIIIAAIAGYVSLADFVASRFYYLALFLAVAWFMRALLKEFALLIRKKLQGGGKDEGDLERNAENFQFWLNWIINFALTVAILPALLVLFGVPAGDVRDLANQALFGFHVAGVAVPSIARILMAIAVFAVILILTKIFQRALQKGPFAHSQIDSGVENSLTTLIGYAGLLIALFAGVSTAGFDLGNLALIAGALSVGIGFGLQSIVNNFVSGLILLFERPIKVGDWIVTPSGEGTVKKISVRSTEIETFDRASIIIPNSELMSSTVTNWTHRNKIGRIVVPVGVSYNADPEKVQEILLKCAHEHPLVTAYPEPFVVWKDFGASSLDFDVRAYLSDISKGLTVRTELRFAIFKALAEAGIEIPFPQRDVHVKSMPKDFFMTKSENDDA